MKLRNKKTGEIKDIHEITSDTYIMNNGVWSYNAVTSLAELNEDWEDVEPDEVWYIDYQGMVWSALKEGNNWFKESEIGNYFGTKEEAEKAVEKLKAWKRLKDKGFRFTAWYGGSKNISYEITSLENETYIPRQICDDLDLLLGGEE